MSEWFTTDAVIERIDKELQAERDKHIPTYCLRCDTWSTWDDPEHAHRLEDK